MTLVKPDGTPWPAADMTPNGTPFLNGNDPLHWLDDWTQALAETLDESFRPYDEAGNVITPASIGAAPASHTHTPASIGAAPASHTHTASQVHATWTAYSPTLQNAGNTTATGYYVRMGVLVIGGMLLTLGSDVGTAGALWTVSLPSNPLHWRMSFGTGHYNSGNPPIALTGVGGNVAGLLDARNGNRLHAAAPTGVTWTSGNQIACGFFYLEGNPPA